ncbi:trypsin iota-like [Drosophila kikkawai]|uniref:trypsin n=1 Tax=Drosophila kikkawai TaxID=30033 RepID=A0A6P4IHL4_DROKI|nr:trypsin iota-like [Drosophila kikkawai]
MDCRSLQLFPLLVVGLTSGRRVPYKYIIGGADEAIENAPWQVSIQYLWSHICGGSIYSSRIILTAAHCLVEYYPENLGVRLGSSYNNYYGSLVGVSLIRTHEKYDSYSFDNDVGLLFLDYPLNLDEDYSIQAIELAEKVPPPGTTTSVTGWGITEYGETEILQSLETDIVDLEECKILYKDYSITKNMLCTSNVNEGTCQGDSGGALVFNGQQVGIVSWAEGCADPAFPTVYANVPALRKWIEENAKDLETF